MKKLIGILAISVVAGAWADVQISAGECAATFGQLPVTIVNKNTYAQQMSGYMVSFAGTITEGKFETSGYDPYLVNPNGSPAFKWTTCPAIGTPIHPQLETSRGKCGDLEPPATAGPMACTPLKTAKPNYDANLCVKDSLSTNRGDGYGGIVDSYKDQTQIQVRIPAASFNVSGKAAKFDPRSMGGPFYMMALMTVQEYFYIDAQFLMALGASKSGAGLVDAATGTSLYKPAPNDGATPDDSKFGSFGLNYVTATKVFGDYPKYFTSLDDIKSMVADNGTGATLANSPQQVNSAMLGAMNLWWYLDATQSGKSLCFRKFLQTAKDKAAGLKLLLAGYENGPQTGGDGPDYANRVLPPSSNAAAVNSGDITPFMKPYLWGVGTPAHGTTQYISDVFGPLDVIAKSGAACSAEPIYDAPISRADLKALFFGQGGTAAKPGFGGLHWHVKMSLAERNALDAELDCAFDALKGQSPSTKGLDAISFRYDFLSILRVAKSNFPSYLDKFHDNPAPKDGFNSDYNNFVNAHATPVCPDVTNDIEWPRLVLSGETLNKGQVVESPLTKDNVGIESRQYTLDPNWVNWIEAPANFTVPATLAASQPLWYRISDSCGNTTTERVPWSDGPPLAKPVATPPGGAFFGSVTVTLDVPGVTGEDIYYTIDGSTPTFGSTKWDPAKPIVFSADATLKAFASKAGFSPSEVVTWTFTKSILPVTKTPTANPPGKNFSTLDPDFTVTLSTDEAGAIILYTTNGSDPDTVEGGATKKYLAPITVGTTMTIKARATKAMQLPSSIATFEFKETAAPKVATPVATPPGAGQTAFNFMSGPLAVTLSDATADASIQYSLDGGAAVAGTAVSIAKTTVLKAWATKTGSYPSDTLTVTFTFTPPVAVSKAYYQDLDGDGRIETVIVQFEKDIPNMPDKIGLKLSDETGRTQDKTPGKGEIAFAAGSASKLIVTLKDPFLFGATSVTNRDVSGHLFPQDNIPLVDNNFAIDDSVPPVVFTAHVQEPDSANPEKRITITLSEAAEMPLTSQTVLVWKHIGAEVTSDKVRISHMQKTGDRTYVVYVDSNSLVLPILGDSVALVTGGEIKDGSGNVPAHKTFKVIEGDRPSSKPADIFVTFPNGTKDKASDGPEAQGNVVFIPMNESGVALTGNAADGKCTGSCFTGDAGRYVGPVFHIVTPGPVSYDFTIFNNVGEFLAKGHGYLNAADLAQMHRASSKYTARVVWTGHATDGRKAGTGAYILQSTLTTDADERTGAPKGTTRKRITFGLLRSLRGS